MKKACIWIVCAVLAAGLFAALTRCDREAEMDVFTMSEKEETCIQVAPGRMFALRFQGRPGTGYTWAFSGEPDGNLLQFLGETVEERPDRDIVGGSEFFRWNFKALAAGEAEIKMQYARPWENGVPPHKVHVFKVKIQAPAEK